ncbi:MAG: M24 family metallopeptidase, partial [Chthoniobacterales bacterium]
VAEPGTVDVVHTVLARAGVSRILVPGNFPYGHATRLQQLGYELETKKEPFFERRVVKTDEEVRHVESAQRATEQAVAAAHDAMRQAAVRDGVLWLDGAPLTSERIKKLINVALMERDCVAQHTIVAGGDQACDPHHEGTGPLPAGKSVIFDVFPRSATTRYFADMSRTV